MIWGIIYLIGVIVSILIILLLASYEKYVKEESIEDFGAAMMLIVGSWITVAFFLWSYKDSYLYILKHGFKKK